MMVAWCTVGMVSVGRDDGGGGVWRRGGVGSEGGDVLMIMVMTVRQPEGEGEKERGGEWGSGLGRSKEEEQFGVRQKKSEEKKTVKFFRRRRGAGGGLE
ncbi:hypothetical protein Tco_1269808 [Tanacetum coccineum]